MARHFVILAAVESVSQCGALEYLYAAEGWLG